MREKKLKRKNVKVERMYVREVNRKRMDEREAKREKVGGERK